LIIATNIVVRSPKEVLKKFPIFAENLRHETRRKKNQNKLVSLGVNIHKKIFAYNYGY